MPKLPKQYKAEDGRLTPEAVDVDDELERQYARANRDKSREREEKRLGEEQKRRKDDRQKVCGKFSNRTRKRSRQQTQPER